MKTITNQDHDESGSPSGERGSPVGDGVTAGLVAVIVGTLSVMAAYGEVFLDVVPFLVVFAGLGVWAARSDSTRLRWVIAALVAGFVAMNTVYAVQDLSHPESPAPFIATAIVIGSGIITVVLAVLAARGRPARARRVWTAGLAGLGVLVVGSLVAAGAVDDVTVQPGDTVVAAQDYEFPERVEIDPTSDAIVIDNEDRGRHTFVVDDRIARVEVPASSRVRVDIGSLEAGSYRYYCDVPGHEAMEGTIVVG